MRKPKAGTLKRPPIKKELPNPNAKKIATNKVAGPDYVGPYSRYGTAGPVNENVSNVRDILKYDDNGLPIPYRKKGGTMKKVIKKVVGKAPVKKTVAKKPMMKSGGPKRSLRKYQGDEGGSEVGPTPDVSTAKTTPAKSFSDYYKDNVAAGLSERKARKIAMVEAGVKDPKRRVDPNAVINAIGNTASAVGQAASAFKPQPSGSGMKRGGTMKKALPKAGPGKIIKAAKAAISKIKPKAKTYGESGQYSRLSDMKRSEAYRAGKPYKAPRNSTMDLVGMGGIGAGLAAGILSNKRKKKTAKPSKPKQLGPQSFAKGGVKTMVKSKKK